MANVLEMAIIQAIQQLHAAKSPQRRIARDLGIDRGTVARYLKALRSDPKPAIPPTGSEGSKAATFQGAPAPAACGSVPGNAAETAAEHRLRREAHTSRSFRTAVLIIVSKVAARLVCALALVPAAVRQ